MTDLGFAAPRAEPELGGFVAMRESLPRTPDLEPLRTATHKQEPILVGSISLGARFSEQL